MTKSSDTRAKVQWESLVLAASPDPSACPVTQASPDCRVRMAPGAPKDQREDVASPDPLDPRAEMAPRASVETLDLQVNLRTDREENRCI